MLILEMLKSKGSVLNLNLEEDEEELTEDLLNGPINVEEFEPFEEGDVQDA